MKVNELANKLNITSDTVRFYSRNGFLSPQKNPNNGYKLYSEKDQHRLQFIISARQLGFTVNDIANILQESDQGHTACGLVREIIVQKLAETEKQFQQTLALRNRLQLAITDWQDKPNKAPSGNMVCHLIEGFSDSLSENVMLTKTPQPLSKQKIISKEACNE